MIGKFLRRTCMEAGSSASNTTDPCGSAAMHHRPIDTDGFEVQVFRAHDSSTICNTVSQSSVTDEI